MISVAPPQCPRFSICLLALLMLQAEASAWRVSQSDSLQVDSIRSTDKPTVVVSASRWNERASTVSRQITVVTARDVRDRNPGTTADLLEGTGEVYMQRSQAGGGSPRIRGFAANSVLLVVDGIRMNNAIYRSGNLQNLIQVDANALASTEILFGPGSVQYGSDALGGVVVLQTKDPVFSDTGHAVTGSGFLRFATATAERTGSAEFDVSLPKFASYTSVTYSGFGDVRSGRMMPSQQPVFGLRPWLVRRIDGRDSVVASDDPYIQSPTGYQQFNALQKLRWRLGPAAELRYTGYFTTSSEIPRYDRLVELRTVGSTTLPRSAEWYYGPQTWIVNALSADVRPLHWLADEVKVVIAHQAYRESRHSRNFGNPWRRNQTENLSILSANVDVKRELDDSGRDRDLYYGFELTYQDVTSTAQNVHIDTEQTSPGITRYPDGGSTVAQVAAYTQFRWEFHPQLSLAAGVRATALRVQSHITPESVFKVPFSDIVTTPGAITGSIGGSWRASTALTVQGNLASGFRAPNVDDIAKVFESEPGRVVVPNPALRPVTVLTAEAGVHFVPVEGLQIQATAYRSWLRDALEKRPFTFNGADSIDVNGVVSHVVAVQNVGQAALSGVSLALDATLGAVRIHVTATGVWGRDQTSSAPLEHVTPAFGLVRITYTPVRGLDITADARWSAAWLERDISPADQPLIGVTIPQGGLPAWTVAGVRASYDVSRTCTLQGAVENIFDLQYRSAGSGISAPGRNVVIALRVRP